VVGRNGGPLHGLWCVTEAKNDQQKITLRVNTRLPKGVLLNICTVTHKEN
jgi:hypothetical protein